MKLCKKDCLHKPIELEGCWNYKDIVGSTVAVASLPIVDRYKYGLVTTKREVVIEDVIFRVMRDGKIIPLFKFVGVEDYYPFQGIFLTHIDKVPGKTAICGCFLSGEALCGHNCESSKYPDSDFGDNNAGGLTIVNDDGSIVISNRPINIVGAVIEDPNTDNDDVTNIQIKLDGGILD